GDALGTLWVGGDTSFSSGTLEIQITAPTLNILALASRDDPGYAIALAALTGNAALANPISVSQHDHLDVAGVFDWSTGAGLASILNNGYTPTAGDVFNLLDWSRAINGDLVDAGGQFRVGSETGTDLGLFDLGGNYRWDTSLWANLGLLVVSVPEPARVLMLGIGLAWGLLLRRRHL
ncbi:MAG: PEP-CTERM sorting domain-containing protein, partial [Prosthecobacter sp.]